MAASAPATFVVELRRRVANLEMDLDEKNMKLQTLSGLVEKNATLRSVVERLLPETTR